ncbi:MAG: hypothetical protein ACLFRV_03935 [Acidimicrobiales bacterium]
MDGPIEVHPAFIGLLATLIATLVGVAGTAAARWWSRVSTQHHENTTLIATTVQSLGEITKDLKELRKSQEATDRKLDDHINEAKDQEIAELKMLLAKAEGMSRANQG